MVQVEVIHWDAESWKSSPCISDGTLCKQCTGETKLLAFEEKYELIMKLVMQHCGSIGGNILAALTAMAGCSTSLPMSRHLLSSSWSCKSMGCVMRYQKDSLLLFASSSAGSAQCLRELPFLFPTISCKVVIHSAGSKTIGQTLRFQESFHKLYWPRPGQQDLKYPSAWIRLFEGIGLTLHTLMTCKYYPPHGGSATSTLDEYVRWIINDVYNFLVDLKNFRKCVVYRLLVHCGDGKRTSVLLADLLGWFAQRCGAQVSFVIDNSKLSCGACVVAVVVVAVVVVLICRPVLLEAGMWVILLR